MKIAAKFVLSLLVLTVACTFLWSVTANQWLYDCTDSLPFDYLRPGDWVHPWSHGRVAVVHQIIHDRSMSEPDTIKAGWSVARLWLLWGGFFGSSVVVSLLLALVPWHRTHPSAPNHALQRTEAGGTSVLHP